MKKSSTAAAPKKAAGANSSHPTYKEMIKDAIVNLKERNGSSRQALKKYIQNNHTINVVSQTAFDSQFNKAIKNGVDKGEFFQPKGPSGTVKLAKKEPAPKAAAKPAAKPAAKAATTKTTTAKKATAKKPAAKATTTKKAAAPKKTTAAKPKANTAKPRKAPASAPAVVEVPKVLGKTKSGRVTKSTAAAPAPKKAAPAKGRTTTKRTSK